MSCASLRFYYQHHSRADPRAHPVWVEHVDYAVEGTYLKEMIMCMGEDSGASSEGPRLVIDF